LGWLRQWWWALALAALFLGVVVEGMNRPAVEAIAPINRRVDSLSSELARQRWERSRADSLMQLKIDAALLLLSGAAATKGGTK
jgi:hypothetical protein